MDKIQINQFEPLETVLSHILTTYLDQLYCICVLWTNADFDQIVTIKIIQNDYQMPFIWLNYEKDSNIDEIVLGGVESGCQAFIATPNSTLKFLDSYENVRYDAENRWFLMHVIVLPSEDMSIETILNRKVVRELPNILLIVPSDELGSFDLITAQFAGQKDSSNPVHLDSFDASNRTFVENSNLFPDKFADLQQRTIRVSFINYEPYASWTDVEPGTGNANSFLSNEEKSLWVDGTEVLMFLEYCNKHNCSITAVYNDAEEWGTVYPNKTGDGIIGTVYERRAEAGVAALYNWLEMYEYFEFSASFSRAGVTCLCPKPLLVSGLLLPVMPFTKTMWIASGITFIGIFLTIYVIRKLTIHVYGAPPIDDADPNSIWFQLLALFLTQSMDLLTRHLAELVLFTCCLMTSFMLENAYSGGLASIMTVPQYEPPIDTWQQIVEKKIQWGATADDWTFEIRLSPEHGMQQLIKQFHKDSTERLMARTSKRDICLVLETMPYGTYCPGGDYLNKDSMKYLQLMEEDIYYAYCVAMTYKTWPFKDSFDLFVLHVAESGIQKSWELQTAIRLGDPELQLAISTSRQLDSNPMKLTVDSVSGVIVLRVVGICFSTFVLILEMFWHKMSLDSLW